MMKAMIPLKKILKYILPAGGFLLFLFLIALMWLYLWPGDRPLLKQAVELEIEKGWGLTQIAQALEDHGLITHKKRFVFSVRMFKKAGDLKAGHYRFDRRQNNWQLMRILTEGKVLLSKVTIPEGVDARFIAGRLAAHFDVDSTEIMALVHDTSFCRQYGIEADQLEGYLYPDTYFFEKNSNATQLLGRMVEHFQSMLPDSFNIWLDAVDLTLHKAVTLASIIEGEVQASEEYGLVSSVYHNRLRKRIPLQADPTIQYIIDDGPRRLYNKDLELDSPYNTYKHYGLPPGPVSNPGLAALKAAVKPLESDYLYFVATGEGTHTFSRSLEEHNRAKARFDQVRRQVRRQRR